MPSPTGQGPAQQNPHPLTHNIPPQSILFHRVRVASDTDDSPPGGAADARFSAPAGFHSAAAAGYDSAEAATIAARSSSRPHYHTFSGHVLATSAYNGDFNWVLGVLKKESRNDTNLIPLKIFTYGFQPVVLALVITGTAVALCVFAPAAMTTIGFGLLSLVKVSASAEIAKIVGACFLATTATLVVKPVINNACEFSYTKIVSSYFNRLLNQSPPSAAAAPTR